MLPARHKHTVNYSIVTAVHSVYQMANKVLSRN